MFATKTSFFSILLLFAFLLTYIVSTAQLKSPDVKGYVDKLSRKGQQANITHEQLDSLLERLNDTAILWTDTSKIAFYDSATTFQFLEDLANEGSSKGYHFQSRINCLKANQVYYRNIYLKNVKTYSPGTKEKMKRLLSLAMDQAYKSGDDHLIAFVSLRYAKLIKQFGELGLAVMYGMNGIELYEKLSIPIHANDYQFLAEMLYNIKEYDDCIKYAKKAAIAWEKSSKEFKPYTISCINTVALGFHRQNIIDSAFIYYRQALQMAEKENIPVWVGIISGNMGQIYYAQKNYDTAYALLIADYEISKKGRFYDNAANSLQWAARVSLARGNTSVALAQVKEARELLKLWPDANYLKNIYYTSSQIFREMNDYDSAFYYNNLFTALNDSLVKIVSTSSTEISKARLNDQTSKYNIEKLNRQKREELTIRNFLIAFIVLSSLLGFLYVNRLRIRQKHKEQLALSQKNADIALVKEQLLSVTQRLKEKTSIVDGLQQQLEGKSISEERQALATTISSLTILTDSDWVKFKTLFEQLYPAFFMNLQEKVIDITTAELRMAALTRLRLSTQEIASILGISINSVYKTRQRLRQRLNLDAETAMEETIARM